MFSLEIVGGLLSDIYVHEEASKLYTLNFSVIVRWYFSHRL